MKAITLKSSIPLKPIDHIKIRRTVEQLETVIIDYPRYSQFDNKKDWLNALKRHKKARYDLYVLKRQEVRRKNREDKAAQVGFWAPNAEYFYIPKAINYEQLNNN